MIDKNLVLINYLRQNAQILGIENFKIKSEYSLNDNNINVIVVQMQAGEKQVLYCGGNINDYFLIQIFGQSIREEKEIAVKINNLIGENIVTKLDMDLFTESEKKLLAENGINLLAENEAFQIMFMQFSNAQTITYQDIQRVGYTLTLKTIINKIN